MKTYISSFLTGTWPAGTRELGDRYAQVIAASVAKHAPQAEFVLFTDRESIPGVQTRTIPNLDGWWGSLYQFSPEAFPEGSRVLALDMDTAIIGDMTPLLELPLDKFIGINDTGPRANWTRRMTNGMASWQAGPRYWRIWEAFLPNVGKKRPFRLLNNTLTGSDEPWLHQFIKDQWVGWDELLGPGVVMSYKWHLVCQKKQITDATKVIYFHGLPRPHSVNHAWNPHR